MTRRFGALLLLLLTVLVVRRTMAGDGLADLRSTALAFGFALIAAALAGDLVGRVRLPRLSGYLLFGLACGPYAADLISRTMAGELQQINGLAIALIAIRHAHDGASAITHQHIICGPNRNQVPCITFWKYRVLRISTSEHSCFILLQLGAFQLRLARGKFAILRDGSRMFGRSNRIH